MTEYETKSLALLERIAASLEGKGSTRAAPSGGGGVVFPNYGKAKGMPVAGADMKDLEFYANGARRSLADSSKSRWHDKERDLLAAIETEIARQTGVAPPGDDGPPPPGDEDAPPPF